MKFTSATINGVVDQESKAYKGSSHAAYLPHPDFTKKNHYVVIAVVTNELSSFLDEAIRAEQEIKGTKNKKNSKVQENLQDRQKSQLNYSDETAPDIPYSIWELWMDIGNKKSSIKEKGGLHVSYRNVVIKYIVIPQVMMGVYATTGLHEKIHFSIPPELIESFVEDATSLGIEVQFIAPGKHYKDDVIEFWTPGDQHWDTVEVMFNHLDWENNINLLKKERGARNNHEETGGTTSLNIVERMTKLHIAFPTLKNTTRDNMVPDMVCMSKMGLNTGWVKSDEERETDPLTVNRERVRTLLFLKTIHPKCYIEAMTNTATRAGFNDIVVHTDDKNGRWEHHKYVMVSFVHVVIDPMGEMPCHARLSKVAYSRKSIEDFLMRYYYVHESKRDIKTFLDHLRINDPDRFFYDEETIKSGTLKAREMVAHCFYYTLPNIDKRRFLSAFIDPIHRLAEAFLLPFEAIIDVSYCIGWCTEPAKFAIILDDWIQQRFLPTHQMLCFSVVEAANEKFGCLSSGPFPRCKPFANKDIDRTMMETNHQLICDTIRDASIVDNDVYRVTWKYEEFVMNTSDKISNMGGFSGQHWVQCLISLLLLNRPEWSEEAFIAGTTTNYSRFVSRFGIENAETVKSIFESVSLATDLSRFLVENVYCEMYKTLTQARDCFHLQSRFYMISRDENTNKFNASYTVNGSQTGAIPIRHKWWENYPRPQTRRMKIISRTTQHSYDIRRELIKLNGDILFCGSDGQEGLPLTTKKKIPSELDEHVQFGKEAGQTCLDYFAKTRDFLKNKDDFPGFTRLSSAGQKASEVISVHKKPQIQESGFFLPEKNRFDAVMGYLLEEVQQMKMKPISTGKLPMPRLPVTCFKRPYELTTENWTTCGQKM